MALRQREWAQRQTESLREKLGNKCVDCGKTKDLEFDVIINDIGNDDHHRKMEWSWRLSFYRKQFFRNNLALRCKKCNALKGNKLILHDVDEHPY